ncbi:glutathione S-transferase [Polynucleobacter sp. 73C-SIWE]|uniref:glutathione S-transferase n=1 Tax=Polynucleobacter sp. 73C-SIWE TaxID=2689098 RepID=UPI001C0C2CEF|nr:glutathione S-transferase [Polynucleobacter sp. 73C-SIWE]MBU3579818.1 glutathione S-transferase [Polynucleobacter sp. 73C-SIWE]
MMPILYSYRRCPYAMRARMALKYSGIQLEHREIALRDKPKSMLLVSPKGTVPVLCVDGHVIDQSLDIMHWALDKSDPDGWKQVDEKAASSWVEKNDGSFKTLLDQYKYPNRYPELETEEVISAAMELMLNPIESALHNHEYLLGNKLSWVDIAIFPFIRQFAGVDPTTFEALPLPKARKWLTQQIESELFNSIMEKHPTWVD